MSQIFISYRRADSASVSGRIYDRLVARYGKEKGFKDVDTFPAAADSQAYLEQIIPRCAVHLVTIGRSWLESVDRSGRRLENPDDPVRLEIETALRHNIPVLLLLVEEGTVPPADRLPPSLQRLVYLSALPVRSDPDFDNDMWRVIAAVDPYMIAPAAALYHVPPGYSPPMYQIPPGYSPAARTGTTQGWGRIVLYVLTGLLVLSLSGLATFRHRLFSPGTGPTASIPITFPTASTPITNQHVVIATELPVSGSNGFVGLSTQYGVDLAIEQNKDLGHGYTLEVVHKNDAGTSGADPSIGTSNIQELINNPAVVGVVGPFNSGVAAAEIPLVNDSGGPVLISPSNVNPGLTMSEFASARGFDFARLHPAGNPDYINGGQKAPACKRGRNGPRALTNRCSSGEPRPGWWCPTTRATKAAGQMLLYEYKLQATAAQRAAIDEAIRVTQFLRNKCLRLWMDGRGIGANDLQTACSRLAHEFSFVRRAPQLPGPPGRRSPRLGGDQPLLRQLPRQATGQEGLSPLPA